MASKSFICPDCGWEANGAEMDAHMREHVALQRRQSPVEIASALIGATPSDIPGLWNAPGFPELTTGQLLSLAMNRPCLTP